MERRLIASQPLMLIGRLPPTPNPNRTTNTTPHPPTTPPDTNHLDDTCTQGDRPRRFFQDFDYVPWAKAVGAVSGVLLLLYIWWGAYRYAYIHLYICVCVCICVYV